MKWRISREAGNRAVHPPVLGSGGNTGLSVGPAVTVPGMVPCTFFPYFWILNNSLFIDCVMLVQIYDETSAKTGLEIKLFFDFVMVIGSACLLILYIKSPIVFVVECGEVINS